MNRTAFLAFVAASLCALNSPAAAQPCRAVEVRNVRPNQGPVMLSAFTSAADFDAKRTGAVARVASGGGTSVALEVCGLKGSSVSMLVFQDHNGNGNGELDRNLLGIPSEPWGASANPTAMAPPTWATTEVPLAGTGPLVIQLPPQ